MRAAQTFAASALAALLAAAPALAQDAAVAEAPVVDAPVAESIPFACADGRIAEVAFPDEANAVLVIDDGEPVAMTAVPSDTGARFIAPGVQWLVTATGGTLSVIALDEDATEVAAADPGVACAATSDAVEESDEAVTDDALVDDATEAATEGAAAEGAATE